MTRTRKVILILLSLFGLLVLFSIWYKYEYSMYTIESYEVNSPKLDAKFIIATQGSTFKDAIVQNIVDRFKQDSIYIKVIDISTLKDIEPTKYKAILIIHTWENWKPPSEVKLFLEKTTAYEDKIIVLTTSGEGTYKMEGIDAITGESKIEKVTDFSKLITEKLEPLFSK